MLLLVMVVVMVVAAVMGGKVRLQPRCWQCKKKKRKLFQGGDERGLRPREAMGSAHEVGQEAGDRGARVLGAGQEWRLLLLGIKVAPKKRLSNTSHRPSATRH